MPIFSQLKENNIDILIWKYDENESLDIENFLDEKTIKNIQKLHPKRQKEILITRKMLNILLPNYSISYKKNGEPYLNPSDQYISISHSFPFATIAISKNKIGIDLEKVHPKLQKIKHKFLYQTEFNWIDSNKELEYLTIIWAIKESLYKIHHSKFWSFREHYELSPFDLNSTNEIKCKIFDKTLKEEYYSASFRKIEDFYLAIVKE